MAALLLDTCTFVWLVSEPKALSARAKRALAAPSAELFLSDASIWELCLKWSAGKLELPEPPRVWIEHQRETWRLAPLPLEAAHFYATTELVAHHRDPFDRLLVAQAISRGLTVVTPDEAVRAYPVASLW